MQDNVYPEGFHDDDYITVSLPKFKASKFSHPLNYFYTQVLLLCLHSLFSPSLSFNCFWTLYHLFIVCGKGVYLKKIVFVGPICKSCLTRSWLHASMSCQWHSAGLEEIKRYCCLIVSEMQSIFGRKTEGGCHYSLCQKADETLLQGSTPQNAVPEFPAVQTLRLPDIFLEAVCNLFYFTQRLVVVGRRTCWLWPPAPPNPWVQSRFFLVNCTSL